MKRNIILMAIVGICCETSLAINAIGPPIATLKKGQFAHGFDYSFTEVDFEVSGYGLSKTVDDVEFKAYLTKIGYGITHNCDVFGHLGFADIEADTDLGKFVDSRTLNIGFRTRATIVEEQPVPWGLAFQANWLQEAKDKWTLGPYSGSGEVDIWELQIAIGPTYKIRSLSIYGGPFLYWVRGDLEIKTAGVNRSFEIKEESIFGGFAGVELEIVDNISANFEYQLTGDSYAIGAGILYKF